MKNSPITTVLLGLLAVSAIASALLSAVYIANAREFRKLNTQVMFINQRTAAITSLANDAMEYSKRNPAIDPILESVGAKQRAGQTPVRPGAAATTK